MKAGRNYTKIKASRRGRNGRGDKEEKILVNKEVIGTITSYDDKRQLIQQAVAFPQSPTAMRRFAPVPYCSRTQCGCSSGNAIKPMAAQDGHFGLADGYFGVNMTARCTPIEFFALQRI
jgi:hypothetical protein